MLEMYVITEEPLNPTDYSIGRIPIRVFYALIDAQEWCKNQLDTYGVHLDYIYVIWEVHANYCKPVEKY